jgi:hypothetical protein
VQQKYGTFLVYKSNTTLNTTLFHLNDETRLPHILHKCIIFYHLSLSLHSTVQQSQIQGVKKICNCRSHTNNHKNHTPIDRFMGKIKIYEQVHL